MSEINKCNVHGWISLNGNACPHCFPHRTLLNRITELEAELAECQKQTAEARESWLSLEKGYSESLGSMARLCDTVIPYVLETSDAPIPDDVKRAAEEIMDYVDAVRP